MEPSPKKVKALDNYLLYIEFENGERKIFDMKRNLEFEFYKRLIDKKNFKNVKISGINIEWKTGEDIAPETLYYESIPLEKFEGNLQELNI
ncbi:MAG: DUF2442 domain-containing protein [Clostridia bacterium]|nr:DUF2442 domain-containing protein [Clostridia bacterium]